MVREGEVEREGVVLGEGERGRERERMRKREILFMSLSAGVNVFKTSRLRIEYFQVGGPNKDEKRTFTFFPSLLKFS